MFGFIKTKEIAKESSERMELVHLRLSTNRLKTLSMSKDFQIEELRRKNKELEEQNVRIKKICEDNGYIF